MSETREKIIGCGQKMIRAGGYGGFSFREIAKEVGVKSSSIHHHFATKEDLARTVAERYAAAFMAALGGSRHDGAAAGERFAHYGGVFLRSFRESGQVCLCGILTHESAAVPEAVKVVLRDFIRSNVEWLGEAFAGCGFADGESRAWARLGYCSLEGAMAAAVLEGDESWLTDVTARIVGALEQIGR
jgi:TetR/AcrR family transcriptional repressor of nem operon